MFTGIVEEVGRVDRVADKGDLSVTIRAQKVLEAMAVGDSIAVSGCCLTIVSFDAEGFTVKLSKETVAKTAPRWQVGERVNLERAMRAGGRFGGHMVSGHVEGVGEILAVQEAPGAHVVTARAPHRLGKYLIPKGSVTVDGVSLTVVNVGGPGGSSSTLAASEFTLWLIPHTLNITTLGNLVPGSRVNLEADLIAKYLERLSLMKEVEDVSKVA
jgi:riboflavin synthase